MGAVKRGGEAGHARGSVRRAGLAAGILTALAASPAAAFDARVGWAPVQNVAGYRLYVRQSGQAYNGGVAVGLLQADVDGVVRYVTTGLPIGVINYFSVTAYDTSGGESALSNELSLLVTATPTAGAAATPTPTASSTATVNTAVLTATATPTPTASSTTAVNTAVPAATATHTATSTATPPSTASSTPTRTHTTTATPSSAPVGTASTSGLVAAYPFSEASGTTTADASGNGHTGTLYGNPQRTTGEYGSGLQFGGSTTSDRVTVAPNNGFDGLSQGTLEAWVKADPTASGYHAWFAGHDDTGCSYPFEVHINNTGGTAYWEIWAGDTSACAATFNARVALPTPSQWHHLAYVVSGTGNIWYVDGVRQTPTYLAGSASTAFFLATIAASPNTRYDIGASEAPAETFSGLIDELRIYARPLTQAEILADMNAPIGGAAPTATPTPTTAANTAVPTATATRVPTATAAVPPTATPTRLATAPATPTATPVGAWSVSIPTGLRAKRGATVSVPVNIAAGSGVRQFALRVAFNPAVVAVQKVQLSAAAGSGTLDANFATPGDLTVSATLLQPMTTGGALVNISLTTVGSCRSSTVLDLASCVLDGGALGCQPSDGSITVRCGAR